MTRVIHRIFDPSRRLPFTLFVPLILSAHFAGQDSTVHPLPPASSKRQANVRVGAPSSTLTFHPVVTYQTGDTTPASVTIADFNRDGKLDVAVANYVNVGVLLGNGDGTLQPVHTYPSGTVQSSIAVADFNGDGIPDVATSGESSTIPSAASVLLGTPGGGLGPVTEYASGGEDDNSVVAADLNGDGKSDLVVASWVGSSVGDGAIGVLIGDGNGNFKPTVSYSSGGATANAVAVADLNGDGKLDVVVQDASDNVVAVLLGNGDGTLQPPATYTTGGTSDPQGLFGGESIAVADVNGDGKPDVVVVNSGSNNVSVLLNNGDGTFQTAVTYNTGGSYPDAVAISDINGDGIPDIVVVNRTEATVAVLLGNGGGTFQNAQTFSSGGNSPNWVAVGDLNRDGMPDLVVANEGSALVGVLINSTMGSLLPTTTTLTSSLNPAVVGQSIMFFATVTSTVGSPPNGETVTFYNGSSVLGTGSLSSGVATFSTSSLAVGVYSITAVYAGDTNFASSTSPVLKQFVNSTTKSATATTLTSSLNPSTYGQKVTLTATVTNGGGSPPTGRVSFTYGNYAIGGANLNTSGVATLTLSTLNADAYPLTAVYKGDANNLGSTSPVVNQVVNETTSSATLTSSPNPSNVGQAVTFTAKFTSPTVKPSGPVTFTAGKTTLGTVELGNGSASLTTSSLSSGSTVVTVTFFGDSNIQGSSASVTQVVGQSSATPTTTTLTYAANNTTFNETFNATVTSTSGTPTGTVSFTVGVANVLLGTQTLNKGQATLTVPTLSVGSNTVTATYTGNSTFAESSAWITQTFVMPVTGQLYLQQEGGSAGGTTTFGTGTTQSNFVSYYTGLPNNPNPTGQLLVGTFTAGTLVNFGMYTTFGNQSGWAFSTGTDQASLVAFADLSDALGLNHGITQQTSATTWLLNLDDALSYLYDDDNNDVLMELIVVPQNAGFAPKTSPASTRTHRQGKSLR